jgi:predicted negative regulator of RcsB-dependent stress response
MASHLDLEEQEQLDQLKAFWKQYGNLVTWVLILALGSYAAWNGWNLWQRDQGAKAGALYDELDKAARAGDAERTTRIFADMKERYPRATFTHQGGLIAARTAADKGQLDAAQASLAWVAEHAGQDEYRAIARLRLAGLLLDQKKLDEALKQVDAVAAGEFAALAADRRGDILVAQGKPDQAKAAYQKAWEAMDAKVDYRRIVEAKLNVVGGAPASVAASASGSGGVSAATGASGAAPSASATTGTLGTGAPAAAAAASR